MQQPRYENNLQRPVASAIAKWRFKLLATAASPGIGRPAEAGVNVSVKRNSNLEGIPSEGNSNGEGNQKGRKKRQGPEAVRRLRAPWPSAGRSTRFIDMQIVRARDRTSRNSYLSIGGRGQNDRRRNGSGRDRAWKRNGRRQAGANARGHTWSFRRACRSRSEESLSLIILSLRLPVDRPGYRLIAIVPTISRA